MIYVIIALLFIILCVLTAFSIITFRKYSELLEEVDKIEEDLDASVADLERSYAEIQVVMQMPLASDDINVRRVVNAVKNARTSVVRVLLRLTSGQNE